MYRKRLQRSLRHLRSSRVWRTRTVFLIGAVLVGLSASLLAHGADYASLWFDRMIAGRPWLPFVLTPAGLMLITWATQRFFPGAEGSGIPQAIAALHLKRYKKLRHTLLSLRIAAGKGLMIVLGLACGASIGREGPTIHIAAAISHSLTRFARFPHHDVGRGLIMAGGAAGLGAAFNTPLAGVVFAIEEMARNYEDKTSGTVFTAVIIAGLTALAINGNYTYFGIVNVPVDFPAILLVVPACGIIGGLAGGAFSALLIYVGRWLSPFRNAHPVVLAGAIGLLLALIGWASAGSTWGTGYEEAREILTGEGATPVLFAPLKFLATLLSYWTGMPGGIFAPSLSIGAGLGHWLTDWFPLVSASAVALLGMTAYFTGVVQTPITAVVIITEMTGNQELLLPIMATALIADGMSKLVNPQPVYRALAEDFIRGIQPGKN